MSYHEPMVSRLCDWRGRLDSMSMMMGDWDWASSHVLRRDSDNGARLVQPTLPSQRPRDDFSCAAVKGGPASHHGRLVRLPRALHHAKTANWYPPGPLFMVLPSADTLRCFWRVGARPRARLRRRRQARAEALSSWAPENSGVPEPHQRAGLANYLTQQCCVSYISFSASVSLLCLPTSPLTHLTHTSPTPSPHPKHTHNGLCQGSSQPQGGCTLAPLRRRQPPTNAPRSSSVTMSTLSSSTQRTTAMPSPPST
jgi:hypothetical protein